MPDPLARFYCSSYMQTGKWISGKNCAMQKKRLLPGIYQPLKVEILCSPIWLPKWPILITNCWRSTTSWRLYRQNIGLQKNALEIVKIQKEAARATELAVQKFQAEVLKSQSLEFEILQKIKETENRINFLLGRYPQDQYRGIKAIS